MAVAELTTIKKKQVQPSYRTGGGTISLDEALAGFIRSRKLGVCGANGPARPRTLFEYESDLKPLFEWLNGRGMTSYNEITRHTVLDYIEVIQTKPWKQASKSKVFRTLKAFFRWIDRDPECAEAGLKGWSECIPKIPKNPARMYVPTEAVMMQFLDAFDRSTRWGLRDYTVCCLLIDCGARIGEVCHLKVENILEQTNELLIPPEGKTGERRVPLSPVSTMPALKRWLRERAKFAKSDYLFLNKYGRQCQPGTFIQAFDEVRQRTGLGVDPEGNLTPHTMRHYFATQYLVNGGQLHTLKGILGHASFDTLQIYVHLANQRRFVSSEHARCSPLDSLLNKGATNAKGTRTGEVYRLRHGA